MKSDWQFFFVYQIYLFFSILVKSSASWSPLLWWWRLNILCLKCQLSVFRKTICVSFLQLSKRLFPRQATLGKEKLFCLQVLFPWLDSGDKALIQNIVGVSKQIRFFSIRHHFFDFDSHSKFPLCLGNGLDFIFFVGSIFAVEENGASPLLLNWICESICRRRGSQNDTDLRHHRREFLFSH